MLGVWGPEEVRAEPGRWEWGWSWLQGVLCIYESLHVREPLCAFVGGVDGHIQGKGTRWLVRLRARLPGLQFGFCHLETLGLGQVVQFLPALMSFFHCGFIHPSNI